MPAGERHIPHFVSSSSTRPSSELSHFVRVSSEDAGHIWTSRTSFGFHTAKLIEMLRVEDPLALHQELKEIARNHEPEDWVVHASTLEAIGMDYAQDVAETMQMDRSAQKGKKRA